MKLLFLDIDGVLNSDRSDVVTGGDKTVENLDPIALGLVQKVVEETDAIVVLSSDWRYNYYILDLGHKLKLPIIYQTPSDPDEDRQKEIEQFLKGMKDVETYVILDDWIGFTGAIRENVVKVDAKDGVSYENYLTMLSILGGAK